MANESQPTSADDHRTVRSAAGTNGPIQSATSPAKSRAFFQPASLEPLTKLAILASLAVYLTGFIVAVHWYTRCGVPVSALTHDVFLAAGVQFVVVWLSALSPLLAAALVERSSRTAERAEVQITGMRRLLRYLRKFVSWLTTILTLLTVPYIGVYHLAGADSFGRSAIFLIGTLVIGSVVLNLWPKPRYELVWKFGLLVLFVVAEATGYSELLYSRSPRWLGGARPQLLLRHDPANTVSTLADGTVRCDLPLAGPEPRCRSVYLVYWDERYAYTAVTEATEPCETGRTASPTSWNDDIARGARLCYVRVAAEKLSPLRIPGPLLDAHY